MHSRHVLREGARPEVLRNTLGHTSIDVTQNAYAPNSCGKGRALSTPGELINFVRPLT
jgi:hypothetical protein